MYKRQVEESREERLEVGEELQVLCRTWPDSPATYTFQGEELQPDNLNLVRYRLHLLRFDRTLCF